MTDKKLKSYTLREERVVDDIFWNLSNVEKAMDIDTFHDAVRNIIESEGLPLELDYLDAHWKVDPDEKRKRIMVSLKNHLWRNIKILVGLDYMGEKKSWLQIQMMLVDDPYFTKLLMPRSTGVFWAILAIPLLIAGALLSMPKALIATVLGLLSLGYYARTKQKAFAHNRESYKQIDKFFKEADMKANRTFKLDDVRLFAGAMKKVILLTVDKYMNDEVEIIDTVSKGGGFFGAMTGGNSS